MNKNNLNFMLGILFILEGLLLVIFMIYKNQINWAYAGIIIMSIGIILLSRAKGYKVNDRQHERTFPSM